jgi:hypothetical protein
MKTSVFCQTKKDFGVQLDVKFYFKDDSDNEDWEGDDPDYYAFHNC